MNANDWITHLDLLPHPEGGYYKEVFRSATLVDHSKSAMTSIYYLLENEDTSAFHRLTSPEVWYYHAGYPLIVYVIHPDGELTSHLMTADPSGQQQLAIEAGCWFAAELPSRFGYALVSCAVAPAFRFDDFELAVCDELVKCYPQHEELLERLCKLEMK